MRDPLCWNADVDHDLYECSLCAALAAARREGMERAAGVAHAGSVAAFAEMAACPSMSAPIHTHAEVMEAIGRSLSECESQIRALIDQPASPPPEPERCGACGYTAEDAKTHGDHHLCDNPNPPWVRKPPTGGKE